MSRKDESHPGEKSAGIRLSTLNIVMICIGLVLATLMVVSMYRTTGSVERIVTVSNNYLTSWTSMIPKARPALPRTKRSGRLWKRSAAEMRQNGRPCA